MLLPVRSQHVFVPIDQAWQKSVNYMELRPDAFVQIDNPSQRKIKKLNKSARYFFGSADDPTIPVESCIPSRQCRLGSRTVKQFARSFRSTGELSAYKHWENRTWIAGFAIDPKTKQVNSFAEGKRMSHHVSSPVWDE